jgi:transcription antitermination protein NusB
MPGRNKSRERALQVLFPVDTRRVAVEESLNDFYNTLYANDDAPPVRLPRDKFMEEIVHGVLRQQTEIDDAITRHSTNWRIERMAPVDRNILRIALFELLKGELAPAVIIDQALALATRFSAKESPAFIHGLLDAARKAIEASRAK